MDDIRDPWDEPITGEDLAVRWAQRDAEYAKNRGVMSPETAESIRQGRKREAANLPAVGDRARMWARADAWMPPGHQEFGGLRDWLDG